MEGERKRALKRGSTAIQVYVEENDVSFMDTEPVDVSTLNTEPFEFNVIGADADGEVSEESNTSETDSNGDDRGSNEYDSEVDIQAPLTWSDCEDENRESPTPPEIDIKMAPSYEVKRIYSDLIDACRGLDEETLTDSDEILKRNISTGDALFRQMSLSESMNETEGKRRTELGNSASEFYLACLHTLACSRRLQHVVKRAGMGDYKFSTDDFLEKLRASSVDNKGGYSVLLAVRQLAITTASVSYSVSHFKTLYGLIDRDDLKLMACPEPAPLPSVKIRAPRKKDDVKEENVTQMEIINEKSVASDQEAINRTPEGLARDVLKSVKTHYREQGTPTNMLEVAYAETLPDVVSRLFGVAFVVRDGHVSLSGKENVSASGSCTTLMLKPDQPPEKNKSGETEKHRNQHIASFSAKFLKHLIESGKGFKK